MNNSVLDLIIPIPNKPFYGFENCLTEDKVEMQQHKIIYLYYRLLFKKPILEEKIITSISQLCTLMNVSCTHRNIEGMKERLVFLQKEKLININLDLESIKKNTEIEIKLILNEEIYSKGYTLIDRFCFNNFLKLDCIAGIVYLFLIRNENKSYGYAFTSISYIQKNLHMGVNKVIGAIEKLKESNYIRVENDGFRINLGDGKTRVSNNRYYIIREEK